MDGFIKKRVAQNKAESSVKKHEKSRTSRHDKLGSKRNAQRYKTASIPLHYRHNFGLLRLHEPSLTLLPSTLVPLDQMLRGLFVLLRQQCKCKCCLSNSPLLASTRRSSLLRDIDPCRSQAHCQSSAVFEMNFFSPLLISAVYEPTLLI